MGAMIIEYGAWPIVDADLVTAAVKSRYFLPLSSFLSFFIPPSLPSSGSLVRCCFNLDQPSSVEVVPLCWEMTIITNETVVLQGHSEFQKPPPKKAVLTHNMCPVGEGIQLPSSIFHPDPEKRVLSGPRAQLAGETDKGGVPPWRIRLSRGGHESSYPKLRVRGHCSYPSLISLIHIPFPIRAG